MLTVRLSVLPTGMQGGCVKFDEVRIFIYNVEADRLFIFFQTRNRISISAHPLIDT